MKLAHLISAPQPIMVGITLHDSSQLLLLRTIASHTTNVIIHVTKMRAFSFEKLFITSRINFVLNNKPIPTTNIAGPINFPNITVVSILV